MFGKTYPSKEEFLDVTERYLLSGEGKDEACAMVQLCSIAPLARIGEAFTGAIKGKVGGVEGTVYIDMMGYDVVDLRFVPDE